MTLSRSIRAYSLLMILDMEAFGELEHSKRSYRCGQRTAQGHICGRQFARRWNLQRHTRVFHQGSAIGPAAGFVQVVFPTAQPASRRSGQPSTGASSLPPFVDLLRSLDRSATATTSSPSPPPPSLTQPPASQGPLARGDSNGVPWTDMVLGRGRFEKTLPSYEVPYSKQHNQQRGVDWLLGASKERLDNHVANLMAAWGLTPHHRNICITWPQDWAMLEPGKIVDLLSFEACPLIHATRAVFKLSDHTTQLARAIAWYKVWPRRGIELDNFLGRESYRPGARAVLMVQERGPYTRMDGSHCCHNPLCVTPAHIVLEAVVDNLGRQDCLRRAQAMRCEGRQVPPLCDAHEPPCLMQQACLTMFERCCIQASTYRESYGLAAPAALPPRPPFHRYPTFETRLPLTFVQDPAVAVGPEDRRVRPPGRHLRRPALVCKLCPRIKSFGTVAPLWRHLQNKHRNCEDGQKIAEARRTAELWKTYVRAVGMLTQDGQKGPTVEKMDQILSEDFSWDMLQT
ncbi:hypothetical protein F5Y18DRAFT_438481 [Xylariaceae sp. FL1019]|nr:hypothetical protein F5Y18DRAFT_438481 [Xylariaceae sp. FL1019]